MVHVVPPARRDQEAWCGAAVERMVAQATRAPLVRCALDCAPPCWGDMRPLQRWCAAPAPPLRDGPPHRLTC